MTRSFIVFLVFTSIATGLLAQVDFLYNGKGEKDYFNVRKDKVIIKTKSALEAKELTKQSIFHSASDINYDIVIATIDSTIVNLDDLLQMTEVISATYGLEYADGILHYPSYSIFVRFKDGQSPMEVLNKTNLRKSIETIELFDPYSTIYEIILISDLSDILRICRCLFESGLCVFAEPSFIRQIKPLNVYYPDQWGLHNTGQYSDTTGIDIKAKPAWTITTG